jgi:uracil-DNA glycosylase family 4
MAFFNIGDFDAKAPIPLVAQCGKCGLSKTCISPFMKVSGKGKEKILICGEAPGKQEDFQNRPFVGPSGELLQTSLRRYGVEMREDCWITNVVICRPPANKLQDRHVDYCRPNLIKTVKELNPEKILLFGGSAVRGLIDWLWKDNEATSTGVRRWVGHKIPSQQLNAWVCPNWHPSYLLHERNERTGRKNDALELLFDRYVQEACQLAGRPYSVVPDYDKAVRSVFT